MERFDPYYHWLGIPPRDQPPNHYRLLGIDLYESHQAVIQNAADRQMAHLRTFSTSKRASLAQNLLNQVAMAKLCLLDPERKRQYDALLAAQAAEASLAPLSLPDSSVQESSVPESLASGAALAADDNAARGSREEIGSLLPERFVSRHGTDLAGAALAGLGAGSRHLEDFGQVVAGSCHVPSPPLPPEASAASEVRRQAGFARLSAIESRARARRGPLELAKVIGGGGIGLAAGALVVYLFFPEEWMRMMPSTRAARATAETRSAGPARKASSERDMSTSPRAGSRVADRPDAASPRGKSSSSEPSSVQAARPSARNAPLPAESEPDYEPADVADSPAASPKGTSFPEPAKADPGSNFFKFDPSPKPEPTGTNALTSSESTALAGSSAPAANRNADDHLPAPTLPASVELPAAGTNSWQKLFSPPSAALSSLQLTSATPGTDTDLSLTLNRLSDVPGHEWAVQFAMRATGESVPASGVVARIARVSESDDLQFQWSNDDVSAMTGLRNSWLTLDVGGERKWVALRNPVAMAPVKLDFKVDRQTIPLVLDAAPPDDQIELVVADLASRFPSASFRRQVNSAKVDRSVVIEFSDLPGAEIRMQLKRQSPAQFALWIMPRFKETTASEFDLTFPQLARLGKDRSERSRMPDRESRLSKLLRKTRPAP